MTNQPPAQPFQPIPPLQYNSMDLRKARRRRRNFIVSVIVVAVLLLGAAVVGAVLMIQGEPDTDAAKDQNSQAESLQPQDTATEVAADPPQDGVYRLQVLDTELCVGAGPEKGNSERTVAVLADCAQAEPAISLTESSGGVHQLKMHFVEEDWEACLSIDPPAEEIGYLLGPYNCDEAPFGEFTLKAQASGAFTLQVNGTDGMCVDALESRAAAGTALAIMECDDTVLSQQFTFLPDE